jgi:hypothetical protein
MFSCAQLAPARQECQVGESRRTRRGCPASSSNARATCWTFEIVTRAPDAPAGPSSPPAQPAPTSAAVRAATNRRTLAVRRRPSAARTVRGRLLSIAFTPHRITGSGLLTIRTRSSGPVRTAVSDTDSCQGGRVPTLQHSGHRLAVSGLAALDAARLLAPFGEAGRLRAHGCHPAHGARDPVDRLRRARLPDRHDPGPAARPRPVGAQHDLAADRASRPPRCRRAARCGLGARDDRRLRRLRAGPGRVGAR